MGGVIQSVEERLFVDYLIALRTNAVLFVISLGRAMGVVS